MKMKRMVHITDHYVLEDYMHTGSNRFLAVDEHGSFYFDDIMEAKRFPTFKEAGEYANDAEFFRAVYPTKVIVFIEN